jgi:hypothetical protein
MQVVAKRMYLWTLLKPSRVLRLLVAYGKCMFCSPRLAARLVASNVLKRRKY